MDIRTGNYFGGVFVDEAFVGLEAELTAKILSVFYAVYNELGYGFYETVYGRSLVIALQQAGMKVETEVPISVSFAGKLSAYSRRICW